MRSDPDEYYEYHESKESILMSDDTEKVAEIFDKQQQRIKELEQVVDEKIIFLKAYKEKMFEYQGQRDKLKALCNQMYEALEGWNNNYYKPITDDEWIKITTLTKQAIKVYNEFKKGGGENEADK